MPYPGYWWGRYRKRSEGSQPNTKLQQACGAAGWKRTDGPQTAALAKILRAASTGDRSRKVPLIRAPRARTTCALTKGTAMSGDATPQFLTPNDVAKLKIPRMSNVFVIRRNLVRGDYPPGVAIKLCGGRYARWLINKEKLFEWLAAGGNLQAQKVQEAIAKVAR